MNVNMCFSHSLRTQPRDMGTLVVLMAIYVIHLSPMDSSYKDD